MDEVKSRQIKVIEALTMEYEAKGKIFYSLTACHESKLWAFVYIMI